MEIDPKEFMVMSEKLANDTNSLLQYVMRVVDILNDQGQEIKRLNDINGKLESTIVHLHAELDKVASGGARCL